MTDDPLPAVYDELRRLAADRLAADPAGATLDPTALVHEAYLRLERVGGWQSDRHYFHAAARAMRRILVDRAREKAARKRGGDRVHVELDANAFAAPTDLVSLDDALTALADLDPQASERARYPFFAPPPRPAKR